MAARVLIIEDNQANMDLMCYLLGAFGHQPLCAYDGLQGLDMARAERPDLIICDIHLPKLDGYGVVRRLKADPATRAIPVLAASALPVSDGGAALRAAGFDGHLPKSLEPDTLMPSVESFLPAALRAARRPDAHHEAAPTPAPARAQARVLLLDGAPANCGLVASLAAHLGYAPTVVADAAQAQACAGQRFDLLLCDLDTARGAGDPAFDALLATVLAIALPPHPALPVVLIRSAADDPVALALPDGRSPLLLAHPLEPRELAAALARCLHRP